MHCFNQINFQSESFVSIQDGLIKLTIILLIKVISYSVQSSKNVFVIIHIWELEWDLG